MTGGTGLRRFVRGDASAGAPAAAPEQHAYAPGRTPAGDQAVLPGHPAEHAPSDAVRRPPQPGQGPGTQQLPPGQPGPDAESCELCAAAVPAEHGHVADLEQATLMCACRACYLLFTHEQAGRGRYRAVPDRYLKDPARQLTAAQWDQLQIPVGLAFFLNSSLRDEVTGFYPSPAGVTECRLDLNAWQQVADAHPLLRAAAADVEAILISRSDSGAEPFLVPIDACYELAGRMRLHWRGFDGGAEARESIAEFLDGVRSRARSLPQDS